MGRTVLAYAVNDNPTDLVAMYDSSRLDQGGQFINVACALLPRGLAGLPSDGPALLAFGSGRYRDSDVYLAAIPLDQVEDPRAWRYLIGWNGTGQPLWGAEQRVSAPLSLHREVGELSVAWLEPLGLWLLLYQASHPRGVIGHVAEAPWGPWSDPFIVFDPNWPKVGYGHFMHSKGVQDGLSDPGRNDEWGGEYGPYLIDRYTLAVETGHPDVKQARVYFVLSTWNPYNTVLMTAKVQREA